MADTPSNTLEPSTVLGAQYLDDGCTITQAVQAVRYTQATNTVYVSTEQVDKTVSNRTLVGLTVG